MISRCLGLKETLMLSLQLEMTVDYLIPTDLITHFYVRKKGRKEGDLAKVFSRSLWGRGLAPDLSVCIHTQTLTRMIHLYAHTCSCRCFLSPAQRSSHPAQGRASAKRLESRHFSEPARQDDGRKTFQDSRVLVWLPSTWAWATESSSGDTAGLGKGRDSMDAAWEVASSREMLWFDASHQFTPKELWLMFWGAKRWRSMLEHSLSKLAVAVGLREE